MTKKSPSGIALLNQKNRMGKRGNPEITDRFLESLDFISLEGQEPTDRPISIARYHGQDYTIDKKGQVRGLNGDIMTPLFHPRKVGPRLRIQSEIKNNGEWVDGQKEVSLIKLMERAFAPYFEGYKLKKSDPKSYILVPKDGNPNNLHRSNLHYVNKKVHSRHGTKSEQIQILLMNQPNLLTKNIVDRLSVSHSQVNRVTKELLDQGLLDKKQTLQKRRERSGIYISEKMLPIYMIVVANPLLDNLEIAKQLWPEAYQQAQTNQQKKALTSPIVRAKQKLKHAGKIEENAFAQKRAEAEALIKNKKENGMRHQDIAEKLGLKKEQIDNLARQIKKQDKR